MKVLSEGEITRYVATHEPADKAGSYGIQGLGAIFIQHIKDAILTLWDFHLRDCTRCSRSSPESSRPSAAARRGREAGRKRAEEARASAHIEWTGTAVRIIDQTALPAELRFLDLESPRKWRTPSEAQGPGSTGNRRGGGAGSRPGSP